MSFAIGRRARRQRFFLMACSRRRLTLALLMNLAVDATLKGEEREGEREEEGEEKEGEREGEREEEEEEEGEREEEEEE